MMILKAMIMKTTMTMRTWEGCVTPWWQAANNDDDDVVVYYDTHIYYISYCGWLWPSYYDQALCCCSDVTPWWPAAKGEDWRGRTRKEDPGGWKKVKSAKLKKLRNILAHCKADINTQEVSQEIVSHISTLSLAKVHSKPENRGDLFVYVAD